ncbi:hypothetical protein Y032_0640g1010 [Ancylostoma ceylanicum]|uniref:Core-2/I-Branching enzyme n=1 Tax=Ancylostoma ceylanicum TaxID=53326 RepID=A0A016WIY5_9BILA|nr:hypothetical protein Y032_0640g1010 [Ancylostoma ceylanicum]
MFTLALTDIARLRSSPKGLLPLLILAIIVPLILYSTILSSRNSFSLLGTGDGIRGQTEGVRFMRRPETAHVECERVLRDDKEYVKKISKNRTTLVAQNISMTCDNLRRRIIPSGKLRPLNFGVAYARIVYESYEFIEDELRSSYHPQNVFCYSVDRKANANFNKRIKTLAKCFPNVVVTKERFFFVSSL